MNEKSNDDFALMLGRYGPLPAIILNPQGIVVFANRPAVDLFPLGATIADHGLALSDLHVLADGSKSRLRQIETPGGQMHFAVFVEAMPEDFAGWVVILSDVEDLYSEAATLRELVETDPLTGVASRRRIFSEGERFLADHKRHGISFALAIADLDNFKQVNDQCGHLVGDHVLAFVADVMREALRRNDIVGRIGGDEFAILMPHTNDVEAVLVCRRVIHDIEAELRTNPPARVLPSITIGLAIAFEKDNDFGQCLERADRALYRGKQQSLGNVILADRPS